MSEVDRIISAARRRLFVDTAQHRVGQALVATLAIAIAALVADRFFGFEIPWPVYLVLPLVGVFAGLVQALSEVDTRLSVASLVDRRLGLKDRIGTAAALESGAGDLDSPFWPIAVADAERIASNADPRVAFPLRVRRTIIGSMAMMAALVAGVIWAPETDVFGQLSGRANRERVAARSAAVGAEIQAAAESIRQLQMNGAGAESAAPGGNERASEALSTLDRLAEQLLQPRETSPGAGHGPQSADESLTAAADEFESLAEELEHQAEVEERAADEAMERLRQIEAPAANRGVSSEIAEALRRGEFGRAAEMIDQIARNSDSLSTEEREAMSEELRELAERIRQAERQSPQPATPPREEDVARLVERGVEPAEAERIADRGFSPDEAREALREQEVDPDLADRLARDMERRQLERESARSADERLNDAAERMRQFADAIDPTPPPPIPPPAADPLSPPPPPEVHPESPQTGPHEPERDSQSPEPPQPRRDEGASEPDRPQPPDSAPRNQQQQQEQSEPRQGREQPTQQQGGEQSSEGGETGGAQDGSQRQGDSGQQGSARDRRESGGAASDGGEQRQGEAQPSNEGRGRGGEPQPQIDPEQTAPREGGASQDQAQEGENAPRGQRQAEQGAGDQAPRRDQSGLNESGDRGQAGAAVEEEPTGGNLGASPEGAADRESAPQTPQEFADRLEEAFKQMKEQGAAPSPRREASRQMREQAQRLLEQMSPEEREELERWGREFAEEMNGAGGASPVGPGEGESAEAATSDGPGSAEQRGSFETTPLDLRDPDAAPPLANEQTIAEWFSDTPSPEGAGLTDHRPIEQRARRAAEAIERAMSEEAISPRYRELVKRWADRLPDALREEAERRQESNGESTGGG